MVKKNSDSISPIRVSFVTLGCAKNLVDAERMLAVLVEAGFVLVDSDAAADVTIINTCGFIEDARREAAENIEIALADKEQGRVGRVMVTGCLSQFWGKELTRKWPGIDAVVGLAERDRIAEIVREVVGEVPAGRGQAGRVFVEKTQKGVVASDQTRLRLTERCWAYLRISEGCDQGCSFCTIPAIRGPFRSKSPEAIVAEAEELVADGAIELNLIGQETTSYGKDLEGQSDLAGLLRRLNGIDKLRWIRVLYAHPATLSDSGIEAMAQCEKVVPYVDIPLQHINDRILKLMRRRITRRQTEELLQKLRRTIDKLTIRTTMLVGFPSETEAEFEELLEFVKEYRFEALGGFAYSAERGTAAARMAAAVPDEVKRQRLERLMSVQQPIAFERAEALVGQSRTCLITSPAGKEELRNFQLARNRHWFIGRHPGQAPETDSICYLGVTTKNRMKIDTLVTAEFTQRSGYDLIGNASPLQ